MAIGRITGPMLFSNLERQGVDLAIDGNLIYADVTNSRVGIYTSTPSYTFDVYGNARLANILIQGNTITSTTGKVDLGTISNVVIWGGASEFVITTDGNGNLEWKDLSTLADFGSLQSGLDAANTAIITANTEMKTYVDALNTAMASNVAGANAAIITANNAVVSYVDTLNLSMVGNLNAANVAWQANAQAQETQLTNLWANVGGINDAWKANAGSQDTEIVNLWSNAASQQTTIDILVSEAYSNANAASYFTTYTGNISAGNLSVTTQAEITKTITTDGIFWANGDSYSSSVQGLYGDANVATLLDTFTGNISAGNVVSNFYGNLNTDYINGNIHATGNLYVTGPILQIPVDSGTYADTPPGAIRFNNGSLTLEYYDGSNWAGLTNSVSDQQLIGDNLTQTFTLDQAALPSTVLVSINGVIQNPSYAYTVAGDQITFAQAPLDTDLIDVRFIASATVPNLLEYSGDINLSGNLIPGANVTYSLGDATHWWKDLYLSSTTIFLGGTPVSVTNGSLSVGGVPSYSNVNVAAYIPTDPTITGLISSFTSNAAFQDSIITTLQSNAAFQDSLISTVSSNVTTANTEMKSYVDAVTTAWTANAVTQLSQITGANAAIVTANTDMKSYVDARITATTGTSITQVGTITSGTWNGSAIGLAYGGTGASSAGQALTNLLPTGTTSGYVLTTNGPGSFYWAAAGGGSTNQGTKIDTTRTTYTATAGQTLFTGTGTYTPGAGQLRIYQNGVRQFPSEYTETSSTSFTLGTAATVGDVILAEVDAYVSYTVFANAVVYNPTGAIPVSSNTAQLAIDSLESRKAALTGATFTGDVTITGNLSVANLVSQTTQILSVTDPLVYLNASAPQTYNYSIGTYSHFGNMSLSYPTANYYQHTGFTRDYTDGTWKLFSNVAEPAGGVVSFTNAIYDAAKVGALTVANTTTSTSTSTGALVVSGGAGVAGNVYATTFYGAGTGLTGTATNLTVGSAVGVYGYPLSTSGARFSTLPVVASDGVMEVGRYIDFHTTNTDTADYTVRLETGSGGLLISGNPILHAGTYNSYAPTLTGGGASGTWAIAVSGSANSASYSTTQSAGTNNTTIATTAFVSAAMTALLPTGVITMWSGSSASIPSGWYLCNGANGTPDLRDRFVIGAGSGYAVGATGGSTDAVVVSHTHTATSTVTDAGHDHGDGWQNSYAGTTGSTTGGGAARVNQAGNTRTNAWGTTSVTSKETTGITVATSISTNGSSGTNANLPPYYALCYIMKA